MGQQAMMTPAPAIMHLHGPLPAVLADYAAWIDTPPPRQRRTRRPTLAAALREAKKAGQTVKGAVFEPGRVTLIFGDDGAPTDSSEWDEALRRGKH
jgi:hypothetical protein